MRLDTIVSDWTPPEVTFGPSAAREFIHTTERKSLNTEDLPREGSYCERVELDVDFLNPHAG